MGDSTTRTEQTTRQQQQLESAAALQHCSTGEIWEGAPGLCRGAGFAFTGPAAGVEAGDNLLGPYILPARLNGENYRVLMRAVLLEEVSVAL